MKILFASTLLFFVSNCQSVIINCQYQEYDWPVLGIAYECRSNAEFSGNLTIVQVVRGTHLRGKTNADVDVLFETGETLQSIPRNLASFFSPSWSGFAECTAFATECHRLAAFS